MSHFYRATPCVSAVFAVARCPSVRLSVCLSVCHVMHSIQTAEDIVKLLYRSDSPIILVFLSPTPVPNSKGNPFSGDAKEKGVRKFCDFVLKSPSVSETVRGP